MMDAGLVGKFDQDGNAAGYLVVRFGNAGRADFWDGGLCWWSFREFDPKTYPKAIFETPEQARQFIERKQTNF